MSLMLKRTLWWIVAGTRGGPTRAKILAELLAQPKNANQLSQSLNLDYKTIRHHLEILLDNKLLIAVGSGYGVVFFPSPELEANLAVFKEIVEKIGLKGKI